MKDFKYINKDNFSFIVVDTIEERDQIPCELRQNGTIAVVTKDSYRQYQIKGEDYCNNENWQETYASQSEFKKDIIVFKNKEELEESYKYAFFEGQLYYFQEEDKFYYLKDSKLKLLVTTAVVSDNQQESSNVNKEIIDEELKNLKADYESKLKDYQTVLNTLVEQQETETNTKLNTLSENLQNYFSKQYVTKTLQNVDVEEFKKILGVEKIPENLITTEVLEKEIKKLETNTNVLKTSIDLSLKNTEELFSTFSSEYAKKDSVFEKIKVDNPSLYLLLADNTLKPLSDFKAKEYTSNTFKGSAIPLDNVLGSYSTGESSNYTSYTVESKITGGWAVVKVNASEEPEVDGVKLSGATFKANTDMYMFVRYNGSNVDYFFSSVAETSLFDVTLKENTSTTTTEQENSYVSKILKHAEDKKLTMHTDMTKYKKLIADLDSAGLMKKLDLMYVFAGDGSAEFKCINIVDPSSFNATPFGGLTWSEIGVAGNGVNGYLDTNLIFNNSINYRLEGGVRGAVVVKPASDLNSPTVDFVIESDNTRNNTWDLGGQWNHFRSNSSAIVNDPAIFKANSTGVFMLNRISKSSVLAFKNGTSQSIENSAMYLPSRSQKIANPQTSTTYTLGCYFLGTTLTDENMTSIYNLLKNYHNV